MSLFSLTVYAFPDGRMDIKNAAAYTGLSTKTLAQMRCWGTGPKFIKRGHIFYFQEDLDAWLNADGRFTSTKQYVQVLRAKVVHHASI